jgi:hypothetical protein
VCSNAIIVLQKGPVFLKDCTFSCNATTLYTGEPEAASLTKIQDNNESTTEDYNYDESEANPGVNNEAELDVLNTLAILNPSLTPVRF